MEEGTAKKGQEGSAQLQQQLAGLAEQQQALLSLLRPTSLFQSKVRGKLAAGGGRWEHARQGQAGVNHPPCQGVAPRRASTWSSNPPAEPMLGRDWGGAAQQGWLGVGRFGCHRVDAHADCRPHSPPLPSLQLLRDVRLYKKILRVEDEEFDVVSLAARLSNVGYRVAIRTAIGGGHGTDCFHNLRHEFLVVQGEGDYEGAKLIVEVRQCCKWLGCWQERCVGSGAAADVCVTAVLLLLTTAPLVPAQRPPALVLLGSCCLGAELFSSSAPCLQPAFAAQFQISHSTPRYDGLLAMLPSDIVATAATLAPLVRLLCAEMQLAFESHGVSLPPWRQSKSMLSK